MKIVKKEEENNLNILLLRLDAEDINKDGQVNENVYHDEMFMSDLYIEEREGYPTPFIMDYNKSLAFNFFSPYICFKSALSELLDQLKDNYNNSSEPLCLYEITDFDVNTLLQEGK